jgi:hypothetical protein
MATKQTRDDRVAIDTRPEHRVHLGRPNAQAVNAALNGIEAEQLACRWNTEARCYYWWALTSLIETSGVRVPFGLLRAALRRHSSRSRAEWRIREQRQAVAKLMSRLVDQYQKLLAATQEKAEQSGFFRDEPAEERRLAVAEALTQVMDEADASFYQPELGETDVLNCLWPLVRTRLRALLSRPVLGL